MSKDFAYRWGIFPLWILLSATIFFRAPIPIDETRYLSVAWEMWQRGDFLVPYLNGHTYSHKPPLLFWLFLSGWSILGVNEWWPRMVGPLCALLNLVLVRQLATRLWPDNSRSALSVPWFLIATLLWTLFASSTMFDTLLTCCVLLAMLGLFEAAKGFSTKGWSYVAVAVGLGLLTKGPVILLHVVPTAVLAWFWQPNASDKVRWFFHLILACLAGCAIALCWALPAAAAGGEEYASAILWHQTADRTVGTKIHARSFFWYLQFSPLLFFPWITWPRIWNNLRSMSLKADPGLRFCVTWLATTLLLFSLLPSKQLHYLIPMLPAFALLCARAFDRPSEQKKLSSELVPAIFIALSGIFLILMPRIPGLSKLNWVQSLEPYWGLSVVGIAAILALTTLRARRLSIISLSSAVVASIFVGLIFFFQYVGLQYDLSPAALKLKQLNDSRTPVAFVGDYQGQLHFLGRLDQPLPVIHQQQIPDWTRQNPQGYLIYLEKDRPQHADYAQPHREHWLIFRTSAQALPPT